MMEKEEKRGKEASELRKVREEQEKIDSCFWERKIGPFSLTNLEDLVSTSYKCDGVSLCSKTVCLIDVSTRSDIKGKSLVIKLHDFPIMTEKTTSQLLEEYDRGRIFSYETLRRSMSELLQESKKKFPHISGKSLFIPLEGAVKKNTSWYNLLLVEDLLDFRPVDYPAYETKISFANHLEWIVPMSFKTMYKRARIGLKLYYTYIDFLNSFITAEGGERLMTTPILGTFPQKFINQHGREKFSICPQDLSDKLIQTKRYLLLEEKHQVSLKEISEAEELWFSMIK